MKVGIVGVSGAVGKTLLELFERHEPEQTELYNFGSARSAQSTVSYRGNVLRVREFTEKALAGMDVVFLCVSGSFALNHACALARNSIVIDNSSAFRYCGEVPLLVPPVNGEDYTGQPLLANANCSSAIALTVLGPLERVFGLEHVLLSTYQSASGAGREGMEELLDRTGRFSGYLPADTSNFFHYNLAYNVVPHIDDFQDNGYTKEEMKACWEFQKILHRPDLKVSASCVRVPVLRSHAEAITVKLRSEAGLTDVYQVLEDAPGLLVADKPSEKIYPMPSRTTGRYEVEVGRLRHSLIYGKSGLDFFVSGDQLLRGAALNAYEIYCLTQGRSYPVLED